MVEVKSTCQDNEAEGDVRRCGEKDRGWEMRVRRKDVCAGEGGRGAGYI